MHIISGREFLGNLVDKLGLPNKVCSAKLEASINGTVHLIVDFIVDDDDLTKICSVDYVALSSESGKVDG